MDEEGSQKLLPEQGAAIGKLPAEIRLKLQKRTNLKPRKIVGARFLFCSVRIRMRQQKQNHMYVSI